MFAKKWKICLKKPVRRKGKLKAKNKLKNSDGSTDKRNFWRCDNLNQGYDL